MDEAFQDLKSLCDAVSDALGPAVVVCGAKFYTDITPAGDEVWTTLAVCLRLEDMLMPLSISRDVDLGYRGGSTTEERVKLFRHTCLGAPVAENEIEEVLIARMQEWREFNMASRPERWAACTPALPDSPPQTAAEAEEAIQWRPWVHQLIQMCKAL